MNKILLQVFIMVFLVLAMTACGPSQAELDATAVQVAANLSGTQTAQSPTATPTFTPSPTATDTPMPTSTPTPTPTDTPTITPTPTPQWMGGGLVLEDLPEGFRVMTDQELSPLRKNLPVNSVAFGFSNDASSQVVMGYFVSYPTRAEQKGFDGMLPDLLDLYATAYGATSKPEAIKGLNDLGEIRAASTFVAGGGNIALRWDNILFRRAEIGAFLFMVYPDGDTPAMSSNSVARLLDKRLGEKLSIWWDGFDENLSDPWKWVNENPERWNLTEKPGFLRIYVSPYAFPQENFLRRLVAQGDFTIKTHLIFEPKTNYQFAGLVIYQDEKNHLAFGRAYCGNPEGCVGNGIYFDIFEGGIINTNNYATKIDSPNDVYLRLESRGTMVTAFYSADGVIWVEAGTHEIPANFQVNGVGLMASNNITTPNRRIPADFDFFELSENE